MTRPKHPGTRMQSGGLPAAGATSAYEASDLPPKGIAKAFGGLFASLLLSLMLVAGLLTLIGRSQTRLPATGVAAEHLSPLPPRLETSPPADRTRIEATAKAHLRGFGWVDRSAGLAHVPIETAMRIVAEQGWPDDAAAPSTTDTARSHRDAGR